MQTRIRLPNVNYVGPTIAMLLIFGGVFAVVASARAETWVYLLLLTAPPIFIGWFIFNQYLLIDFTAQKVTKPFMLFCRHDVPFSEVQMEPVCEPAGEKCRYSMQVSGEFGEFTAPLPNYETYVTLVYNRTMAALGG